MSSVDLLATIYKRIKSDRIRRHVARFIAQRDGGFPYSLIIRNVYWECHDIKIGYGSYGGCFDIANIPKGVSFGNYCSIASNVKIFRANHPADNFTSHPILYNPAMGFVDSDKLERKPLSIGNDVWLGENVIILPNVTTIGNGAIVGAGSVVSKNVDPYAVVAGNPAKQIKMRFSASVIEKIENSRWWELRFDELIKRVGEFNNMTVDCN